MNRDATSRLAYQSTAPHKTGIKARFRQTPPFHLLIHGGQAGMTKKFVIFDCDGTLVDSQNMICTAVQHSYDAHGLPCPSRETVLSVVGLSLAEAFTKLAEGAPHPVDLLAGSYKDAYRALRLSGATLEPLFPGARDVLDELRKRNDVTIGMATGKSQRGVRAVMGLHGLYDCFATIKTSDDAPSKPHPAMVLDAMAEVGAQPADTVMIGDTAYDIGMARAAGVAAIGVSWGYHSAAMLHEAGADHVIDDFTQLLPLLDAIWANAPTQDLSAAV
jgi:phosphoglycolate phosphatase